MARLRPVGDIDVSNRDELVETIRAALTVVPTGVVVDLAAVGFLDSSGTSPLVTGRAIAVEHAVTFRAVDAVDPVARVVDVAGIWDYLPGDGWPTRQVVIGGK